MFHYGRLHSNPQVELLEHSGIYSYTTLESHLPTIALLYTTRGAKYHRSVISNEEIPSSLTARCSSLRSCTWCRCCCWRTWCRCSSPTPLRRSPWRTTRRRRRRRRDGRGWRRRREERRRRAAAAAAAPGMEMVRRWGIDDGLVVIFSKHLSG